MTFKFHHNSRRFTESVNGKFMMYSRKIYTPYDDYTTVQNNPSNLKKIFKFCTHSGHFKKPVIHNFSKLLVGWLHG